MKSIFNIIIIFALLTQVCSANFEGELELEPDGCEVTRKCLTKSALRYTDPNGWVWEAKKGLETDGASIPKWAQWYTGGPYDKSFLKAAVVHDHYCDRHVRSWWRTHRAFYYMLVDLGVPIEKAKVMYYAVFVGGPKWIKLIKPLDCGRNCINKFNSLSNSDRFIYRSEKYSNLPKLEEDMKYLYERLSQSEMSLEEIEALARDQNPEDYYFVNGDTVIFDPKVGIAM